MATQPTVDPQDPYGFKHKVGRDIGAVQGNYAKHPRMRPWPGIFQGTAFGYMAPVLLDPWATLSQKYPQVSQIIRERLGAALKRRNNEDFSRCNCRDDSGHRCDSEAFQSHNCTLHDDLGVLTRPARSTAMSVCLCPDVFERLQIYGIIGAGSFGVTYLAREKGAPGTPLEDLQQYAIKSKLHHTQWEDDRLRRWTPEMVAFDEPSNEKHHIPEEAVILIYLDGSDRFPHLDSVYTHGMFTAILMTPCVDPSDEGVSDIDEEHFKKVERGGGIARLRKRYPRFPAFDGNYLMSIDTKEPQLNELEGCKVAAQFLQALNELADMGLWHGDISINNYLMDQNLNVQLIDFGLTTFSLDQWGFHRFIDHFITFHEYQMMPERATELEKYDNWRDPGRNDVRIRSIYLPNDERKICLWKYSTLVYGFLHGFWPWDEPVPNKLDWYDRWAGTYGDPCYPGIKRRRKRMINEDVPISEHLSQDCRDMLQANLARDPSERPSIGELSSFPWYSQWSAEELESGRPLKRPCHQKFNDHNRTTGRKGFPWPSAARKLPRKRLAHRTNRAN
ncbi:hypothetical protein N7457_004483 [Penicillium paradoxum]|uniref:uncharacterized protein n=1 Tax=Penicillium paradoxum TaxID=176176 RepID=UPI0025493051|nr:uncharacterized protein N7457_004483 [Penicillium paradoxum]KAJ5782709.1 hypothetical protein N7457_004483 [Penicillium paradoxum]